MVEASRTNYKVSRQKLLDNHRANLYANIDQVYKDNKDAPVLTAGPPTKKTVPRPTAKPTGKPPGNP